MEGKDTLKITVTCKMLDIGSISGSWTQWNISEKLQENTSYTASLYYWKSEQVAITVGKEESGNVESYNVSCTYNSSVGIFTAKHSFKITG